MTRLNSSVSVSLLSPDSGTIQKSIAFLYDRDAQAIDTMLPLGILRPQSTSEIIDIIQQSIQDKISITVRASGTGFSGGAVASQKGWILLTGHLKKILNYDPILGVITVEPGVTVKQINQYVDQEGWVLPSGMESDGVASLAGIISLQSRPYSLGKGPFVTDCVMKIKVVNGEAKEIDCHPAYFCGAEGLFGVISEITLRLLKKPNHDFFAQAVCSKEEAVSYLEYFKKSQAIVSAEWLERNQLRVRFQGESWRIPSVLEQAQKRIPSLSIQEKVNDSFLKEIAAGSHWLLTSSSIPEEQILKAMELAKKIAEDLALSYYRFVQLLDGRLQLLLYDVGEKRYYLEKLEKFFVEWVNVLHHFKGHVASSHGLGSVYKKYLPPFVSESDLFFLGQWKEKFDPHRIFSPGHFFPSIGRCVERRAIHEA